MNKPKLAILADIASLRITCEGFKALAQKLEQTYEIVYVKFYSYVAKRNRDFNEYVAAKGYDAVTPIASKRRNKLDSRQIIDATEIGFTAGIDTVALMVGDGDILPIITYLKLKGKDVYEIGVNESTYSAAYTGFMSVPVSSLREGYNAPASKVQVKKAPKQVKPAAVTPPDAPRENKYLKDAQGILGRF